MKEQQIRDYATLCKKIYWEEKDYNQYIFKYSDYTTQTQTIKINLYTINQTDEAIIVFRGTDFMKNNISLGFYEIIANLSFIIKNETAELTRILNHGKDFIKYCKDNFNLERYRVTLVGYSLGGSVAQILGNELQYFAVGFNALGANEFIKKRNNIASVNYRIYCDQISKIGTPIGLQIALKPPFDYHTLESWSSDLLHYKPALKMFFEAHDINTFIKLPVYEEIKDTSKELKIL